MKALYSVVALALMLAMSFSSNFTFNDDDRLRPSGPDRIIVVSMDSEGNRLIEDHPKPVYGMGPRYLPVQLTMPLKQHKHKE